jgi:hypothetical protein
LTGGWLATLCDAALLASNKLPKKAGGFLYNRRAQRVPRLFLDTGPAAPRQSGAGRLVCQGLFQQTAK